MRSSQASASVRKGREIFSFDFSVTAVWEGEAVEVAGAAAVLWFYFPFVTRIVTLVFLHGAPWECLAATKGDDRVKGELKVESIDQDDVEDDFDVAVTTHASGGLSTTARVSKHALHGGRPSFSLTLRALERQLGFGETPNGSAIARSIQGNVEKDEGA